MKKTDHKLLDSEIIKNKAEDIYEVVYADSRDDEIRLNFLKRRQISAHMARWFLDYEYNQLLWSDGIYEILELNPRNFGASEANFLNLIHPDDIPIKVSALNQLHKETKPLEINYRLQFSDGRIKWISEICSTEFDKAGSPVRSYGTVQDVTKYKLTEERFNQKEERYKSLIDDLPEGIIISRDNKCVFLNSAARKLLEGKSRQQIDGKDILSVIHPSYKSSFIKKIQGLNLALPTVLFEQKMLRLDGSEFTASITLSQIIFQDLPATQIIISDITERIKAYRRLKENETRLKELIATKDKFFSIIAHDLRNPFNSILGIVDLLQSKYNDLNDQEKKHYLNLIEVNTSSTLLFLNDLLDWSKVQTGKISFQPSDNLLLNILKDIEEAFSSFLTLKQISITYLFPENLIIRGDRNMLKTVFQNLIHNAIKYSNKGGNIEVIAELRNDDIEIIISDNGIGMSEETKNKLFRIDQQNSIAGTANESGSGLGLILCKDFIEIHRGKIRVESELLKGSKFIFTIPNQNLTITNSDLKK